MNRVLFLLLSSSLFLLYCETALYERGSVKIPFVFFVSVSVVVFATFLLGCGIAGHPVVTLGMETKAAFLLAIALQLSAIGLFMTGADDQRVFQFFKTDLHTLFYLAFVVIASQYFRTRSILIGARLTFSIGIVVGFFGLWQFWALNVAGWQIPPWLMFGSKAEAGGVPIIRVASVFNEAAWFAFFANDWVAMGLACALAAWRNHRPGATGFYALGCCILLCSVIITLSPTAIAGLTFFLLASLRFARPRERAWICGLASIMLVASIMAGATSGSGVGKSFWQRLRNISTSHDPSMLARLDTTQAAVRAWAECPLVGVGVGSGRFVVPKYFRSDLTLYATPRTKDVFDSAYLVMLVEGGLLGLTGFLLLVGSIVWPHGSLALAEARRSSSEAVLLAAAWRMMILRNLFELLVFGSLLLPRFWFDLGIGLALKRNVVAGDQLAKTGAT